MVANSAQEYLFTAGILIAFVGMIAAAAWGRRDIVEIFKKEGIRKVHVAAALLIVLVFISVELSVVKPTQQLFFDDAIYQAMAQQMLHSGQAWMCDYGTPSACYMGEIFHEPIGTSFNLAIGFAVFGVDRGAAYGMELFLSAVAVLSTFFAAVLLFKDKVAALFSELLLGLSPALLVWAQPTTSDIPMLAYFMVAVLFMLIFRERKNVKTLAMFAFSIATATYMKVDALAFMLVVVLMYLVLDDSSIRASLANNARRVKDGLLDTRVLVLFLLFVLAVAPEALFTFNEFTGGNFGYQGSYIQNSCGTGSAPATGNFNLQNFGYNLCENVLFWFNQYGSVYIMQPILFTALAIIGAAMMAFGMRRALLAVGMWFLIFFFIYTAFYGGGVTFGVDWRFMLSMVAQASLFGGFACSTIISSIGRRGEHGAGIGSAAGKRRIAAAAALVVLIGYSIIMLLPELGVSPSSIPQAGDARFYENFVYNSSYLIPNSCAVFTYDPTLFNINNKSALQMSYAYDPQQVQLVQQNYSCMVADWGYWCYTPNNLCANLNQSYNLIPIATANYTQLNKRFGFYYMQKK
ncbi:MAG: glycosyltransferase family 39 protein [Candidatus Micrarchaeales archaeon]|nr:glycosyltransferase family 39 protein [Candidatus Micrarchaeales archaeon]